MGSSGIAIVDAKGHVIDLQSGELLNHYQLVSGIPLLHARDYASQKKLTKVPQVQLDYRHVVVVPIHPCNIKFAVHVQYLNEVLRKIMQVGDTQFTFRAVFGHGREGQVPRAAPKHIAQISKGKRE